MQIEADLLREMTVRGAGITVVAVGVGSRVNEYELSLIVSAPQDKNVILVPDFNLTAVQQQLTNATTSGW